MKLYKSGVIDTVIGDPEESLISSAYGDQSDSYWICTTCHNYLKGKKPPMRNKNYLQLFDFSNIPDLHLSPLEIAIIDLNICFQMIFQTAKSR